MNAFLRTHRIIKNRDAELYSVEQRINHLRRFYSLLDAVEDRIGGARTLSTWSRLLEWPRRGVYFFREVGEQRTESGVGPRITRVGSHGFKQGAISTLRGRLAQHRGVLRTGGGNHRGSIFRLIVGTALIKRYGYKSDSWGIADSAEAEIRRQEQQIEIEVSKVIGAMPFLWLAIDDEPGPDSLRRYIEHNAIALLSNFEREPLDAPSPQWLGKDCNREKVRMSGIWNQEGVDEDYEQSFLDKMETLILDGARRP